MRTVPEIDLTDPTVLNDPFTAYDRAGDQAPLARLLAPGLGPLWAITRHEESRAMLTDPRFGLGADSFLRPPGIPEHCRRYLHTMSEMDGPEHTRQRRLVAPAFTPRRAAEFAPRLQAIVDGLLCGLTGELDLLAAFARPLPMEVICELVGIPDEERPTWRTSGAAVASGYGPAFLAAIPEIIDSARAAVERSRANPGADLLSHLIRAEEDDRLDDTELVTLVWHLVLAGQTPTNLIANAVETLLAHPDQLATLRADPTLAPGAVEELMRWCGPQLLTTPRIAREDVEIDGVTIPRGDKVTASIAGANRDPLAFEDPWTFDITRPAQARGQLGFAHGPHFCLGAPLARVQTEIALTTLLTRFPNLTLAGELTRAPDPGTWRLAALPVRLD
ncbi:cytochrome P450 [Actinokineospora sp. NBRC 105648]|uniref:cytochrome P450 family protein n=1 Tax=Actinokineospora sp. NBRC 105648 TaxID=3032206 RepID=UPI0024A5B537|nr:cytochrome P450 [Actinokineospora sp. NBRC 105648]GLZ36516.1 cytochrome P450 [Actinokineospora sp. NBRC 105648]